MSAWMVVSFYTHLSERKLLLHCAIVFFGFRDYYNAIFILESYSKDINVKKEPNL